MLFRSLAVGIQRTTQLRAHGQTSNKAVGGNAAFLYQRQQAILNSRSPSGPLELLAAPPYPLHAQPCLEGALCISLAAPPDLRPHFLGLPQAHAHFPTGTKHQKQPFPDPMAPAPPPWCPARALSRNLQELCVEERRPAGPQEASREPKDGLLGCACSKRLV